MFEPHPESSDPMLGRVTKITGCASSDGKYSGTWIERSNPESYEGRTKESSIANSSVELAFEGSAVYWRALRSPQSGKADVYIDGVLSKTVDCYSPRGTSFEHFMYFKAGLSSDTRHTIKIVVSGKKHPKSASAAINHIAFEYSAESYKASACFSGLMGKNAWYYQQWNGSEYSDLRFVPDEVHPKLYWSGSGNCKIGNDYQIPDDNAAVRKWIAPHGGVIRIEGVARWNEAGSDPILAIWLNGEKIWPAETASQERTAHDLQATVIQGDSIAFFVARKTTAPRSADPESDRVIWDPVITYTKNVPAVWRANSPSSQNLAQGKYARSKFLVSSYRPFDAVDGDLNTAFIIHADDRISSGDDWLSVDLEKIHMIDRYTVVSQTQNPAYRPRSFTLQKSDDGFAWTDVDAITSATGEPSTIDCIPLTTVARNVPAFRARFVRLYLPQGKPFVLNEFGLYYTEGKSSFGIPVPSGSARLLEDNEIA